MSDLRPLDIQPPIESTATIKESLPNIPVAEDLARYRVELETKIITGNLPPKEWRELSAAMLDKYPTIGKYHWKIDSLVDGFVHARYYLDHLWEENNLPESQMEADPTTAASMCQSLFDYQPEEEVKIQKGTIGLVAMFSDNDYQKLLQKMQHQESDTVVGFQTNLNNLQVIVAKASVLWPSMDNRHYLHENEHIKDTILEETIDSFLLPRKGRDEISDGFRRLHKNRFRRLQSEINAYFSAVPLLTKKSFIGDYHDWLIKLLTEDGAYYRTSCQPQGTTADEYTNVATTGIDSIFELYHLYENAYPDINPAKMSAYTLGQFPVDKWPVVVRLIKQRRGNTTKRRSMSAGKLEE